ncbi:hypothetical protein ACH0C8_16585, partial [Acetobacter lovaniensis]|uniref:hypothetical protein n=1 Tax=Acetobacter lovaniensis TaxID=104100 RepID=UPI00376F5104
MIENGGGGGSAVFSDVMVERSAIHSMNDEKRESPVSSPSMNTSTLSQQTPSVPTTQRTSNLASGDDHE